MACSLEGGGEFDAFFVARDARERDVGKKGDALLRDDRGRRFIIVLGFLTSGSDGIRDVSEPNLQLLERSIRIPMRGFWESREWNRQRAFFVNGLELPLHDNDGPLLKTVEFALRHEYAGFDEKPQPVVVPEEKRERKIGLALLLVGGSIAALSFALPTNFRAAAIAIGSAFIACAMIPIFRR
jgi:hypothetical protein